MKTGQVIFGIVSALAIGATIYIAVTRPFNFQKSNWLNSYAQKHNMTARWKELSSKMSEYEIAILYDYTHRQVKNRHISKELQDKVNELNKKYKLGS